MTSPAVLHYRPCLIGHRFSMAAMHLALTGPTAGATPSQRLGRIAHDAVLNPNWPTPRWDLVRDPVVPSPEELRTARTMRDAVLAHPYAAALLSGTTRETSILWTLPDNTGPAHSTPDAFKQTAVIEYKTATDIEPHGFARAAGGYGYHSQLAWYRKTLESLHGWNPTAYIVAQSTVAPYPVAVYTVPPETLNAIFDHLLTAAKAYRVCEQTGVYPAPENAPADLFIPQWLID
jgi:hypothetical protein